MIILYGIHNCDKIKKARAWLENESISYEFHDYKKTGCDKILIRRLLTQFPYREIINTRGTTWRKLPDRLKNSLDEKKAVDLLQNNPSIIKRPIFEIDGQWVLGFNIENLTKITQTL